MLKTHTSRQNAPTLISKSLIKFLSNGALRGMSLRENIYKEQLLPSRYLHEVSDYLTLEMKLEILKHCGYDLSLHVCTVYMLPKMCIYNPSLYTYNS